MLSLILNRILGKWGTMGKELYQQRNKEKAKYVELQAWMPRYGSSNHGQDALGYVVDKKPNLVVDFGCGRNNFIEALKTEGVKGVGVDFVYQEADIVAPMHEIPLEDDSVDFITAFDSLEHLLAEDVGLVLEEMKRIATPQADFCFSISYEPSNILVHNENLHPTIKSECWWKGKLKTIGDTSSMGKYLIGTFKI